jgi:hypothetical protein
MNVLRRVSAGVLSLALCAPAAAETMDSTPPDKIFPKGKPSCHARAYDAKHLAAHPKQRVVLIAFGRAAREFALERRWAQGEQYLDTPKVGATLNVRFRGDATTHIARLECSTGLEDDLFCSVGTCPAGQVRVTRDGARAIRLAIGGSLKNGRRVGHYLHLDESCEGRAGGPIVLESGEDDFEFLLPVASAGVCR